MTHRITWGAAAVLAWSALGTGIVQAEGTLAQLYAAKPPAGSAFVRVVNPQFTPLNVQIANGQEQTLDPSKIASAYAIVKGDEAFELKLKGHASHKMQVRPGSFTTLVPQLSGKTMQWVSIDDSTGSTDALKAELRFYNLVSDCAAGSLQVASNGPKLFVDVPAHKANARAINPVQAQVQATCATTTTSAVDLPALKPGDHYSFFLTGTAAAPALKGLASTTEAYRP